MITTGRGGGGREKRKAAEDQEGGLMEDDAAADEEEELSGDGEEARAAKVRDVRQEVQRSWRGNSTKQHTFLTEIGVGAVCVGQERKHHTDEKVPKARRRKRTRFQGWC